MREDWINELQEHIEYDEFYSSQVWNRVLPRDYRDEFSVAEALHDLALIKQLFNTETLQVSLVDDSKNCNFSIKLYALDEAVTLSQSMSILEAMGLEVRLEIPYELHLKNRSVWIHHFQLQRCHEICKTEKGKLSHYFEDLFTSIWHQQTENDSFNQLLFSACLNRKSIDVIRAYTAYLKQIKFPYSRVLIIETLNAWPKITLQLIQLFNLRFDPQQQNNNQFPELRDNYLEMLNQVESLDQDLIFKQLLNLIEATVRTNYFQDIQHDDNFLSFKFKSLLIHNLPQPKPAFEIFVYSPRFEGIHLRGSTVARGGLRWSERKEDYRTEVLGLMKAQMVKNAVIVPAGSKGGFITKHTAGLDREQTFAEVRYCYQLYINALLELTDNILKEEVIHPPLTRIHDGNDPYLVVAADKGTATFSDTANEISLNKQFWLQDAFASGGSAGYDHKKMGITARGAWESVKRHFRSQGRNIQQQNFTVVGIGDMSGDVFGNGMLLSPCIQLVAAFNHLHIFIDPAPNAAESFEERLRLFRLPRSGWNDYNPKLISRGGGVFSRKQKRIPINPEMKLLLRCSDDHLPPDDIIRLILKAPVDLLWNGGIGTYVKASSETHAMVMDKNNDNLRINGSEIGAKAVGEGGNLGFTQLARVEYARKGGRIYTDSIDNSAGVDCSDHEVNLKIMFSRLVMKGDMSFEQRNELLEDMTDDVSKLCLQNNYDQTQILDIIGQQAPVLMHEHNRFINHLENHQVFTRKLENLPGIEEVVERITNNQGLTAPELSILLSYSKLTYKDALLGCNLSQESYFRDMLISYFPKAVREVYRGEILSHPLQQEIIATQLSNEIINRIGAGFGFKMREETGANIVSIARAYVISSQVFNISALWQSLQSLDNQVSEQNRYSAFRMVSGLLERSISWLLRNHPSSLNVEELIQRYQSDCARLRKVIPQAMTGIARKNYTNSKRLLQKQGFPKELSAALSETRILASTFDIIEIRIAEKSTIENAARLFFAIAERLQLNWIRDRVSDTDIRNHWHHLAIVNMRNELHYCQRRLTELILQTVSNKRHTTKALKQWMEKYDYAIHRYDKILSELQAIRKLDFTMTSVAVFEVKRLVSLSP